MITTTEVGAALERLDHAAMTASIAELDAAEVRTEDLMLVLEALRRLRQAGRAEHNEAANGARAAVLDSVP